MAKYTRLWRASHENYCKKHGYDLKIIDKFLDKQLDAKRHIDANNRLLVCSQEWSDAYDYIIYLDADILININAPPIHTAYEYGDKIGIVDEFSQPQPEERAERINKRLGWEESAKAYYKLAGFDIDTDTLFNAGMMVFQPKKHKKYLEKMYSYYEPGYTTHRRGAHYQQAIIGYDLMVNNKCIVMSNEWNCVWHHYKVYYDGKKTLQDIFEKHYFVHFAGGIDHDQIENIQLNNIITII
jgi:lipopolysaccharide biosynthesis glycosyltransferase